MVKIEILYNGYYNISYDRYIIIKYISKYDKCPTHLFGRVKPS